MKQNPNASKQPEDDFSVLSFSSAPNQSFQFPNYQKQQATSKQGYCLIIVFVILGFYFLVFGIVQLSTNFNEIKYRIELIRNGKQYKSSNTFISFKQNTSVLIYLEIQDMTQFDAGHGPNEQSKQCNKYTTNQQMKKTISINNFPLNPSERAIPCGRHESFYPEGKFQVIDVSNNGLIEVKTEDISSSDIIMPSQDLRPKIQWASFQNQRFRNWMVMDAQEKVKKLWGRISDSVSGNYQIKLTVNNQMPEIPRFFVTLSNNEALSGYNDELCYLNFFYAALVFLAALTSFLIQRKLGHRKVLKKKMVSGGQANQIKIFLSSAANTPAVKFD